MEINGVAFELQVKVAHDPNRFVIVLGWIGNEFDQADIVGLYVAIAPAGE
jgi:hypothetical protein